MGCRLREDCRPDGKKKAYVRLAADHDALDVANKVRCCLTTRGAVLTGRWVDWFHLRRVLLVIMSIVQCLVQCKLKPCFPCDIDVCCVRMDVRLAGVFVLGDVGRDVATV